MLMTISLQVCSFTFKNPKKVLDQFTFTLKFQFQIVKLSKSSCLSDIPLLRKRFLNLGMVHSVCNNKQTLHIKLWFYIYFKRITLDQTVICILEFPQFPFSTNTLNLLLILTNFWWKLLVKTVTSFGPFIVAHISWFCSFEGWHPLTFYSLIYHIHLLSRVILTPIPHNCTV